MAKVARRLIPLLNRGLSVVLGMGSGIFFVGYLLFEIPSNLLLAWAGLARDGGSREY